MDLSGGLPQSADYSVVSPKGADPWFGENFALWFWDEQQKAGLHLYLKTLQHLGSYNLRRESVMVALPNGALLMEEADGPGTTDPKVARGPNLEMHCLEPFRRWRYTYNATAQPTTAAEMRQGLLRHMPVVPVAFDIEATMALEPWVVGSYSEGERREWARRFTGGDRYEQLLRAKGTVRTRDGEIKVEGFGMRTHRVGVRNTITMPGHSWLTALFPSGRGFGIMRFCGADGVPQFEEAFVHDGKKRYPARVVKMPIFTGRLPGEELAVELDSAVGRSKIKGALRATNFVTSMAADTQRLCWGADRSDPKHRIMTQGLCRYDWDGEVGTGMIERSVRVFEMPPFPAEG